VDVVDVVVDVVDVVVDVVDVTAVQAPIVSPCRLCAGQARMLILIVCCGCFFEWVW
jgi:hypothetical protein